MLLLLIRRHASFFVMAASAGVLYLVNILLAGLLTEADYGYYALLISFMSVVASFGLGGFDQALVRTAKVLNGRLCVSRYLAVSALISAVLFSVASYAYFRVLGVGNELLALISTLAIALGLFGYGVGRLKRAFVFAQFAHGGHRILLGLGLTLLWLTGEQISVEVIEWVLCGGAVIVACVVAFYVVKHAELDFRSDLGVAVLSFAFGYSVSMLLMNAIGFADRFLVERFFGLEVAAKFFFYANIYVFPFALLQGYVGFRELSHYKERFSLGLLHKDLLKSGVLFSLVLILCIAADFLLTKYFLQGRFEISIIERVLLACLGGARIVYGSLSAAFGAVASSRAIHRVNLVTVSAGIGALGLFVYALPDSLAALMACFLFVWLARASSVYFLVCKGRSDAV